MVSHCFAVVTQKVMQKGVFIWTCWQLMPNSKLLLNYSRLQSLSGARESFSFTHCMLTHDVAELKECFDPADLAASTPQQIA